ALALEPGNAEIQRRYGVLLATLGRMTESNAVTRKAIEVDPLSAAAWSDLGGNYLTDRSQFRQARDAIERALAINPESNFALFNLVTLELLEGHAPEALVAARKAGEVWRQA